MGALALLTAEAQGKHCPRMNISGFPKEGGHHLGHTISARACDLPLPDRFSRFGCSVDASLLGMWHWVTTTRQGNLWIFFITQFSVLSAAF